MSNSYFDWPAKSTAERFVAFDTVRSGDVNDALDLVSAGFEKMPTPAELNGGYGNYAPDTGSANQYVVELSSQITDYVEGLTVKFRAANANTGASTLNVNGMGAVAIVGPDGATALEAGQIVDGQMVECQYDGGNFQLKTYVAEATFSQSPGAIQGQSYTAVTTGGTGAAYTATPSPVWTAYAEHKTLFLRFAATCDAAATLNVSGLGATLQLVKQLGDGTFANVAAGDIPIGHRSRVTLLSTTQAWVETIPQKPARSHVSGLVPSVSGANFTLGAGEAIDSTGVKLLKLATAITKTTSAWAAGTGNGGLDTGTIAADTWYYHYLIERGDTGATDVIFSISSSGPLLPANYTLQSAKPVAVGKTNGSSQWASFTATEAVGGGLNYVWAAIPMDSATIGASRTLVTLSGVPALTVLANLNLTATHASLSAAIKAQCPSEDDGVPSASATPGCDTFTPSGGGTSVATKSIFTDSVGRIAARSTLSSTTFRAFTNAFTLPRR
jgi:hypothetical protein